jgi:hypothetical protein
VRFVILLKCLRFFCGSNGCILQSSGNAFLLNNSDNVCTKNQSPSSFLCQQTSDIHI